ncbi:hypothetical protein JX265_004627 [Neoarthrinium moseri]|uniref:Rhodopsin domain-containing protein n=1 Tax=Neoarthrinium moseri TaxID=1658444 RepID=A0A9Q0ASC4_9PEZI|nr:hypothetical protein JX266_000409 [Neoarthrinium moseri]KAI1874419.1 hypothetical protein JX265_004627 [Neoarthrinium moseri]
MSAPDSPDFSSLDPATQAYILAQPALEPPIGQDSIFDNPPNYSAAAVVLFSVCLVLITLTFIGRVYMKFFVMKQKSLGDYLLILAYALLIVNFVFTYRMTEKPGIFVHQWNVHLGDFIYFLRDVFITSQLYIGSILLIKVAILLEWIRIFAPPGNRHFVYWASHIMIWANVVFYVSIFIAFNIACTPYEYNWNVLLKGNCDRVNTHYTNLATSIFNVISDFMILIIPQRAIWKLHMSTKKKLGVSMVFAIGLLACVSALIRLIETVRHALSADYVYTFAGIMCCCAAELTCGFLVVSVPSFPKAFSAINLSKLLSKLSFRSSSSKLRSSKKSGDASSWPPSSGGYSEVKTKAAKTSAEGDERQLFPMAKLQNNSSNDYSLYDSAGHAERGIYQTTHFEATESFDPNATRSEYRRQEQWDDNRI